MTNFYSQFSNVFKFHFISTKTDKVTERLLQCRFINVFFKNPTDIELSLANAIYIQENVSLVPDFLSLSSDFFKSATSRVDFKNSAVSVRDINSWIEKQTKNRIKDVISAGNSEDANCRKIVIIGNDFKQTTSTI